MGRARCSARPDRERSDPKILFNVSYPGYPSAKMRREGCFATVLVLEERPQPPVFRLRIAPRGCFLRIFCRRSRTLRRRENAALDFGAIQASDGTPNGPGTTRARSAEFQPRRRGPRTDPPASGARLPLETATAPRRHADRLVRSCALTCDIRIGPSENSPALAFSVRPRR